MVRRSVVGQLRTRLQQSAADVIVQCPSVGLVPGIESSTVGIRSIHANEKIAIGQAIPFDEIIQQLGKRITSTLFVRTSYIKVSKEYLFLSEF